MRIPYFVCGWTFDEAQRKRAEAKALLDTDELNRVRREAIQEKQQRAREDQRAKQRLREEENSILREGAHRITTTAFGALPDLLKAAARNGENSCNFEFGEIPPSPYSTRPPEKFSPGPDDEFANVAKEILDQYCRARRISCTFHGYVWKHGHVHCHVPNDCAFGSYALQFTIYF